MDKYTVFDVFFPVHVQMMKIFFSFLPPQRSECTNVPFELSLPSFGLIMFEPLSLHERGSSPADCSALGSIPWPLLLLILVNHKK